MNFITLNNLSMITWYGVFITIVDEKNNVLFSGYNWNLSSILYKDLASRYIKSVGVDNDKMIVKLI